MNKFDQAVKLMGTLSKREGKDLNAKLRDRCECLACPTYLQCAKDKKERLFCFWGNSDCITAGQSCICGSCTVWQEYGMKNMFYCINGPEIAQREMPKESKT